jgi:hypothetical protein
MNTLRDWSRSAPHQTSLAKILQDPVLSDALRVLENTNIPLAAGQTPDVTSLALLHQYQAGFHAAIRALRRLPEVHEESLAQIEKIAKLEARGPWSHIGEAQVTVTE